MHKPYVPLQLRGCHSLLEGVRHPHEFVHAAARFGLDALALTDRNALMGSVAFVKAARAAGIKPLVGVDLVAGGQRATLLARDREGYAACCRLVTDLHRGAWTDPWTAIAREPARDHLVVICDDPRALGRVHGLLGGSGRLHAGVCTLPGRDPRRMRRIASGLGVPTVATGDLHFLEPQDHATHRVLRAAGLGSVVSRLGVDQLASPHASLVSPEEMRQRHLGHEDELARTRAIAELCEDFTELGRPRLPDHRVPEGRTTREHLESLVRAGARERYGDPLPPRVRERLQRELEVIDELGFPGYFLVVREIVDFARSKDIPFVGRGSAADSLVVHCLGFTRVCPLENELVFERFLSRSRPNLPDIDLDFCWRRRDEVIGFVYERYGEDRVATISTHVAFRLRSAYREAAKALGLPPGDAAVGSEALPHHFDGGLAEACATFPECRQLAERPAHARILQAAERLRGLPRHLGMHPGGMVLANQPVTDFSPVVRSAKGPLITQHEMRGIEALGLVKMDLLGQRSLSTIGDTLTLLRGAGEEVPDPKTFGSSDPAVERLLAEGRTLGCFQVESPAMRKLLVGIRARDRRDLTHAIALVRPGPAGSGMKEAFIRRRQGEEPIRYDHPRLERVLKDTHGIMLFQEDILRVSAALAGWSLADGDLVRSALGKKKDPELLERLHARYTDRCAREGIEEETARQVWQRIGDFAAFSFCKAHAATYGHLSFEELWLKAHHPAAFFCAVLNNDRGYYPQRVYLEEARRHGVRFLLPDVNRSEVLFGFEQGAIRMGLGRIKGLSRATRERLLTSRGAGGPFLSLPDLLERVTPDRREAESLVRCGALDLFDRPRPEQLWRLELLHRERRAADPAGDLPGEGQLFAPPPRSRILPRLADYDERRKRREEYELLGMTAAGTASVHGLEDVDETIVPAAELRHHVARTVTCQGWRSATRRTRTKDGRSMRFLTIEDASGMVDTVLFPEVYERFGHFLRGEGPYRIRGRVTLEYGAPVVELVSLAPAGESSEASSARGPWRWRAHDTPDPDEGSPSDEYG